jgi:trehalose 6-phosphate synthase/phosphatase
VGVDRFDYTKGIAEKLRAFEQLLETHPRWRQRVVLIQVAAPSRMTVSEYQQLKREVDELVGRINGRYGSSSFMPVVYVNQSVSRERLTGLYRAADIALITPVRDGMNLVALEYVAARAERGGTLILSEFTGAAHCLPGARLVNPYNTAQLSSTLAACLEQPCTSPEQFHHMVHFVSENTASAWAEGFLDLLERSAVEVRSLPQKLALDAFPEAERIQAANSPLVLLGDGVLRGCSASDREGAPSPRLLRAIRAIGTRLEVYVISSRTREELSEWFGTDSVGLVSEYGLALRPPCGQWEPLIFAETTQLRDLVDPVLSDFVRRTPGSTVEYGASGATWHVRSAETDHANLQARDLLALLQERLRGQPYTVHRGRRCIGIRPEGLGKGHAVARLLARHSGADWVLLGADDASEGSMLAAAASAARTSEADSARLRVCAVNGASLAAGAWVQSPEALADQLEKMTALRRNGGSETQGDVAASEPTASQDPEEGVKEPRSSRR